MNEPKRGLLGTPRPIPTSEEEHQRQHEEEMRRALDAGTRASEQRLERTAHAFIGPVVVAVHKETGERVLTPDTPPPYPVEPIPASIPATLPDRS